MEYKVVFKTKKGKLKECEIDVENVNSPQQARLNLVNAIVQKIVEDRDLILVDSLMPIQEDGSTTFDNRGAAENYLKSVAKEQGWVYYEIVEDCYDYPEGLLLIGYEDKEHTIEIAHYCVEYGRN